MMIKRENRKQEGRKTKKKTFLRQHLKRKKIERSQNGIKCYVR